MNAESVHEPVGDGGARPGAEQLELHFESCAFLEVLGDIDAATAADGPPMTWRGSIAVHRCDDASRWRLAQPLSLTPFGAYGPQLDLGDVIEIEAVGDGRYRPVRVVSRARPWSQVIVRVSDEALDRHESQRALARLRDAGAAWEWCAGNLTVQGPSAGDGAMPAAAAETLARLEKACRP